ncbi:MAG: glycine cleavage system H protein [Verrucomicrobiales bacterium]|jgi:glycine cleavage system H protein
MSAPAHLKFLTSHEWVESGQDIAAVGISDHAQSELSDVVYVELPEIGREVAAGEAVAVVESVKAASDIYAPVSGEIVEVNEALNEAPEVINSAAYTDGWLFKLRLKDPAELEELLNAEDYEKSIG